MRDQGPTAVMLCTCKHEYQDEHYGKGQRVHNRRRKQGEAVSLTRYACTVCEKEKS